MRRARVCPIGGGEPGRKTARMGGTRFGLLRGLVSERGIVEKCTESARCQSPGRGGLKSATSGRGADEGAGVSSYERYAGDPVGFAREIIGVRLWEKQIEILEAVRDYPRVTVRSSHCVGKT